MIDEKYFLSGTHVMAALDKVGGQYLWTEFHRDARHSVNCLMSTVASRSVIGQGMSCFCPINVVGADDFAFFQHFNNLLDGLLGKEWTKRSEVEACRTEYQSFRQEQLERLSTRSRPDVRDVLLFCSAQSGFRARQHLYKVCIVSNHACCFALS